MNLKYQFTKEKLEDLYLEKKFSTHKIADLLEIKHPRTVTWLLQKFNIKRRTRSEAGRKLERLSFSGDPVEKAYMLGLRTGDLHGRKPNILVRIHTTSTHPAQIKMIENVFGSYSLVKKYKQAHRNQLQMRVYCDLDESFDFLAQKLDKIPNWIIISNDYFYAFLAGYADAEGCFDITKSNKNSVVFRFQVWTMDKDIITQINDKLHELGFDSNFYRRAVKGKSTSYGKYNNDLYGVVLKRKLQVTKLINILLKLSHHEEKILKMKLILNNADSEWNEIKDDVTKFRKIIKETRFTEDNAQQSLLQTAELPYS